MELTETEDNGLGHRGASVDCPCSLKICLRNNIATDTTSPLRPLHLPPIVVSVTGLFIARDHTECRSNGTFLFVKNTNIKPIQLAELDYMSTLVKNYIIEAEHPMPATYSPPTSQPTREPITIQPYQIFLVYVLHIRYTRQAHTQPKLILQ